MESPMEKASLCKSLWKDYGKQRVYAKVMEKLWKSHGKQYVYAKSYGKPYYYLLSLRSCCGLPQLFTQPYSLPQLYHQLYHNLYTSLRSLPQSYHRLLHSLRLSHSPSHRRGLLLGHFILFINKKFSIFYWDAGDAEVLTYCVAERRSRSRSYIFYSLIKLHPHLEDTP